MTVLFAHENTSCSSCILSCSSTAAVTPPSACGLRDDSSSSTLRTPMQAKQRASILWLLSKAFDNASIPPRDPSLLQEPYYRDHRGEEALKPLIVQSLANGELYCMALTNIYSDPNYNTLSHAGIISVLMRKGIYVQEPQDTCLTESILIRTNPIKMVSHCDSCSSRLLPHVFLVACHLDALQSLSLSLSFPSVCLLPRPPERRSSPRDSDFLFRDASGSRCRSL